MGKKMKQQKSSKMKDKRVSGNIFYHMVNPLTTIERSVLEVFFAYPNTLFTVREVSRLRKITHPTVARCLQTLNKLKVVVGVSQKNKTGVWNNILWKANTSDERYKQRKKMFNLEQLYCSGIIEKIASDTSPNAIVLFGSYRRGEDMEESDIDLFVVSKEKKITLNGFEKKLHRKVNLTFETNPAALNKEFLNNIINGIVLYGYIEVIK